MRRHVWGLPLIALATALAACAASAPIPTVDVEGTVEARLHEEETKRADVERAVAATLAAQPTAVVPSPVPTIATATTAPPTEPPPTSAPPLPTEVPVVPTATPEAPVTAAPEPTATVPADRVVLVELAHLTGKGSHSRHMFSSDGGGTDDTVHLVLVGTSESGVPYSSRFHLELPGVNDREQGQWDSYRFAGDELGAEPLPFSSLSAVGFRKDETSSTTKLDGDWLLEEFTVGFTLADGQAKTFRFRPNQWFSSGDKAYYEWSLEE